ncbi:HU family DNA-binding protein [Vitreoscilla massiliensis]|uniref:HU family DNA-binding protein n=1 Tax=Vitreoscilla massiliensis TaxID=1689272 RepID=A0ABY4E2J8_9NEIS|nr:HU family DNA-binding protein [Vitreoscilla massiliensis]UOO89615.1 HU family DNA-binding protein [Vitreoscilla massiliensis]
MNKTELIAAMAQEAGISKTEAERVLNAFTTTVQSSLKAGADVAISGFGTFAISESAERQGRNPKTGESITIAAAKKPKFKAAKALKDTVNS